MESNSLDTQKQLILRNEFAQLNIVHNQPISLQEIQFALDSKLQGQTFDRVILQQLFDQMTLRDENEATIDEFIKVYLAAEKILIQKIEQSKDYLQNYQRQARETKNKIQIVKTKEKTNENGITEDSTFTFTIYSAVISHSVLSSDASTYVQITCGSNERKTDHETSLYPQFNYSNSFIIETGDEEIKLMLIEYENKQTIGTSSLNITDLKNQQQLDTEVQLSNDYGNIVGSLKVSMRWIHSKVLYLQDVLNKWEEYAASQSQDLEDYQRDILTLYEPFKQLQIFNRAKLNQPNSYSSQQQQQSNNLQSHTNPFIADDLLQQQQQQFAPNSSQTNLRLGSYKPSFLDNQQPTEKDLLSGGDHLDYKRIAQLATLGYLCLVILVSFQRSMFFDMLIIFKYYDYHLKEEFTGQIYKYFTGVVFFSFCVFDLGWIINFTKEWFNGENIDYGVRYFVDILIIILFLYKLFLMVTYLLNWNHYEQIQAQLKGQINPQNQFNLYQQNDNQQYMNQSNYAKFQNNDNNNNNNHFMGNLNNPKFNQQQQQQQQLQITDTMKTTRYY